MCTSEHGFNKCNLCNMYFCNKNESIFKMFDWKRANEQANEEVLSVIFLLAKFEIKQYIIRIYVYQKTIVSRTFYIIYNTK